MDSTWRDQLLTELSEHYIAGHLRTATYELRVEQALSAQVDHPQTGVTWDLPALAPALIRRVIDRVAPTKPCARLYFEAPGVSFVDLGESPRTWTIGRSRTSDIVLRDPAISRRHALVSSRAGRCTLRDLGSANGVWVNGERVSVAVLHPGDVLSFGAVLSAHIT